jgi:hypothetical protein
MAFWVPPFSAGDDHARDACAAALAQQEAIVALQTRLPEITGMRRNAPELVVRMGIATGEAVVGTIGSELARPYTVIGDSVNLASRLEGVNKIYGTLVIISEETYRLAQQDIEAREVDVITVAGKMEPVRIYELMSAAGRLETSRLEMRKTFAEGLGAYRQQDWDAAQAHFEACMRITPDDGPARVFLERISILRSSPPGADWDGVKKSRSDKTTATGLHQGGVRDHFGRSGAVHDTIGFIKSVEPIQRPRLAPAPTAMTAINDHGLPIRRYRTCRHVRPPSMLSSVEGDRLRA